ncbi:MAG: LamG domain-containing protein [Verrucomicrobia bacterium]|nr:LamG domain-containing protein [Verrucomicrobiota bacterium]
MDPYGTLGRVYAAQAGQMVSHEHDIGGVWTHLTAVRQVRQVRLYVNGRLSGSSNAPAAHHFDLSNTQPLRIGSGAQNSFDGAIADVRLYGEAITESEMAVLIHRLRVALERLNPALPPEAATPSSPSTIRTASGRRS